MSQGTMPQTSPVSSGKGVSDETIGFACLIRIYPPSLGEGVIQLPHAEFVLGRESECSLELGGNDVSRRHAVIKFSEVRKTYQIRDLESMNGTHVNGQRVHKKTLSVGDLVGIGKNVFKFLAGDGIERQYHETIYTMTITDGLTGVANKRFLFEHWIVNGPFASSPPPVLVSHV